MVGAPFLRRTLHWKHSPLGEPSTGNTLHWKDPLVGAPLWCRQQDQSRGTVIFWAGTGSRPRSQIQPEPLIPAKADASGSGAVAASQGPPAWAGDTEIGATSTGTPMGAAAALAPEGFPWEEGACSPLPKLPPSTKALIFPLNPNPLTQFTLGGCGLGLSPERDGDKGHNSPPWGCSPGPGASPSPLFPAPGSGTNTRGKPDHGTNPDEKQQRGLGEAVGGTPWGEQSPPFPSQDTLFPLDQAGTCPWDTGDPPIGVWGHCDVSPVSESNQDVGTSWTWWPQGPPQVAPSTTDTPAYPSHRYRGPFVAHPPFHKQHNLVHASPIGVKPSMGFPSRQGWSHLHYREPPIPIGDPTHTIGTHTDTVGNPSML